jgi:PAS domain-containing protein
MGGSARALVAYPEQLSGVLLETIPEALVLSDSDGRVVVVNSNCERLFGYDRGELLGRKWKSLSRLVFVPGIAAFTGVITLILRSGRWQQAFRSLDAVRMAPNFPPRLFSAQCKSVIRGSSGAPSAMSPNGKASSPHSAWHYTK